LPRGVCQRAQPPGSARRSAGRSRRSRDRPVTLHRLRKTARAEARADARAAGIPRRRSPRTTVESAGLGRTLVGGAGSGHAVTSLAAVFAGVLLAAEPQAASDLSGRVLFSGLGVPGATVTATRGERTLSTAADDDGGFTLAGLDEGTWTVRVEMRG